MQGPKLSNAKLAARFFTKRPATSTLCCRLNLAPKPNLSTALSESASTLWSTHSRRPGHSFGDSSTPSTSPLNLQASFHRLEQTNYKQDRTGRVATQITRHWTHLLQNSKQFPATCSTTECRRIQDLTSHATTPNLPHY